jgi:transcriptional regulator
VRVFEDDFGADWDMTDSIGYFSRILPAVGAFRIEVSHVDGMFKLSQEQKPHIRERVKQSFAQRESTHHQDIATMISRLAPKD